MNKRKKVLICPLDWGLGHATRCIPIINELIKQDADIYIAADKGPFDLLIREYPKLKFLTFPGANISYPYGWLMVPYFFLVFPKLLYNANKEHRYLKELINEYHFDIVISDNRYGLWNKSVKTVFITHQVMIMTPAWLTFMRPLLFGISKNFINKYDHLWIPDNASQENLSGDLSHKQLLKNKTTYIGILSRFIKREKENANKTDICAIISGPEPQRTAFENLILPQLERSGKQCVIITGMPGNAETKKYDNNTLFNHLKSEEMEQAIENANVIISRSGYSTLMDLSILGKKAIFVPTPGQTEQEYLAERLMDKGLAYYQKQQDFNLDKALIENEKFSGLNLQSSPDLLTNAITDLLKN